MNRPIDRVMALLDGVRQDGKGYVARCPAHNDRDPSLSIAEGDDGKVLLNCFAGCAPEDIVGALGLTWPDLFSGRAAASRKTARQTVATYDYRDEHCNLLFQVVRTEPKGFYQRRPDGQGKWITNLGGVRRVLYRLPELLAAAPSEPVFVVEGEKDAENLAKISLVATSNAGGAGKWLTEYSDFLRGRSVVILPDNDKPGKEHAEQVAEALYGTSASTRVVQLPGLPPKGDVSDWLEKVGTPEQLLTLTAKAAEWRPTAIPVLEPAHYPPSWEDEDEDEESSPPKDAASARKYLYRKLKLHVQKVVKRGRTNAEFELVLDDGTAILLGDAGAVLRQARVRAQIYDSRGTVIPPISQNDWRKVAEAFTAISETVDLPSLSQESETRSWLAFLRRRDGLQRIEEREEFEEWAITYCGLWVVYQGRAYLRLEEIRRRIGFDLNVPITARQLGTRLSRLGFQSESHWAKDRKGERRHVRVWCGPEEALSEE